MNDKPINEWKVRDFQLYLQEVHEATYGIKYTARNYAVDARMIRNFTKEHGNEVTKVFIDLCFANHKTSERYPALNFGFMQTYLRERWLPVALVEVAKMSEPIEVSPNVNPVVEDTVDDSWW